MGNQIANGLMTVRHGDSSPSCSDTLETLPAGFFALKITMYKDSVACSTTGWITNTKAASTLDPGSGHGTNCGDPAGVQKWNAAVQGRVWKNDGSGASFYSSTVFTPGVWQ